MVTHPFRSLSAKRMARPIPALGGSASNTAAAASQQSWQSSSTPPSRALRIGSAADDPKSLSAARTAMCRLRVLRPRTRPTSAKRANTDETRAPRTAGRGIGAARRIDTTTGGSDGSSMSNAAVPTRPDALPQNSLEKRGRLPALCKRYRYDASSCLTLPNSVPETPFGRIRDLIVIDHRQQ